MPHDMLNHLQEYYVRAFPERPNAQVSSLVCLNDGWETDVYAFDVEWGAPSDRQKEELILRIYPGANGTAKSGWEYQVLKNLMQANYPVPRTDRIEQDTSIFGKPFLIMERIRGKNLWQPLFHSLNPFERKRLLRLFCSLFAQLHTLDWRPFTSDPAAFENQDPSTLIKRQLDGWQPYFDSLPVAGFEANWQWLRAHQRDVSPTRLALTHWDYHPNNILLLDDSRSSRPAVVIDWAGLEITDWRFDLAWTLVIVGGSEGMQWRGPIIQEYERQIGEPVTDMAYFDAAACIRRLYSTIASLTYGPEKLSMRPGAEALMRKQAPALRRVYELLLKCTGLPIPEVEQFFKEENLL